MDELTLPPEEIRVLGCLVEKQLTTPQQYPLTLNALTLACNQSSNREPVLSLSERTVEAAVTSAKGRGLARFVHPSHGRSAIRFRHVLDEVLDLQQRPLALLAVLMLRGPQTPGELRARTERMAAFETLRQVEDDLDELARRPVPLVVRLARQPGHKEERFTHLLGSSSVDGAEPAGAGSSPAVDSGADIAPATLARPPAVQTPDASAGLRAAIEDLRAQVDVIRRDLEDLRSQLGA
jgi:uncharacterized protein